VTEGEIMLVDKNKCTARTAGRIASVHCHDADGSKTIAVKYYANNQIFQIKETVRTKSEPIKFGWLTIGHRVRPCLPFAKEGDVVTVLYDPADPQRAYIKRNEETKNV
jgi:uncharacterized protein YkuJ